MQQKNITKGGVPMPGVTKDQIKAAKRITAMEFLRRHRPDQLERTPPEESST